MVTAVYFGRMSLNETVCRALIKKRYHIPIQLTSCGLIAIRLLRTWIFRAVGHVRILGLLLIHVTGYLTWPQGSARCKNSVWNHDSIVKFTQIDWNTSIIPMRQGFAMLKIIYRYRHIVSFNIPHTASFHPQTDHQHRTLIADPSAVSQSSYPFSSPSSTTPKPSVPNRCRNSSTCGRYASRNGISNTI